MSVRDDSRDEGDRVCALRARIFELEQSLLEHTRTAAALRESEQKLRTILENSPDSITVMSAEGVLLYTNRVAETRTLEDTLGANASAFLPEAEGKRFSEAIRAAVDTGHPQTLEVGTLGGSRWETRLVPLKEGGRVTAVMGIGAEVTERRRLEEQLRQAQKMEAVGRLTAGLAHNFNNLLAALIPSIQLARRQLRSGSNSHLEDAEHAARRAAELVRELMRFAHPGRGASKGPVDVVRLAQRTTDICRALFDRAIDLEFASVEVPSVSGEAGPLEQVFMNVCLNARDALDSFARAERRIRVEVDVVPADSADAPVAEWVRVRISDNGPGIPPEIRTRIFEPFFTTKSDGRGTGLGLATAYAIVHDHGGRLTCDSTPSEGTTFTVLLPAVAEGAVVPSHPKPPLRGGTETVLVIDDDTLVRSAARGVLEHEGYTVLEAADGENGLAVFRREHGRIAVTLLDFSMPGIRGEAVLKSIMSFDAAARVVAFTGYSPAEPPEGLVAVLEKPVELDELLRVIRRVCDARRAPG